MLSTTSTQEGISVIHSTEATTPPARWQSHTGSHSASFGGITFWTAVAHGRKVARP